MERNERDARAAIPDGYYVVTYGPVLDGDLIYSWTDGQFIAARSPIWESKVQDAADAVCCVRRPGVDPAFDAARQRRYTMPPRSTPEPASPDPATPKQKTSPRQVSLF